VQLTKIEHIATQICAAVINDKDMGPEEAATFSVDTAEALLKLIEERRIEHERRARTPNREDQRVL